MTPPAQVPPALVAVYLMHSNKQDSVVCSNMLPTCTALFTVPNANTKCSPEHMEIMLAVRIHAWVTKTRLVFKSQRGDHPIKVDVNFYGMIPSLTEALSDSRTWPRQQ